MKNKAQLLAYLPYFEEQKKRGGSVAKEHHLMYTTYEKTLEDFVNDVYNVGFIDTDYHQTLWKREE